LKEHQRGGLNLWASVRHCQIYFWQCAFSKSTPGFYRSKNFSSPLAPNTPLKSLKLISQEIFIGRVDSAGRCSLLRKFTTHETSCFCPISMTSADTLFQCVGGFQGGHSFNNKRTGNWQVNYLQRLLPVRYSIITASFSEVVNEGLPPKDRRFRTPLIWFQFPLCFSSPAIIDLPGFRIGYSCH